MREKCREGKGISFMLENKSWQFCEMIALNRQSYGRIDFPYCYLKNATIAEVDEYKSLEIESKPFVDVCELFTPVALNFIRDRGTGLLSRRKSNRNLILG